MKNLLLITTLLVGLCVSANEDFAGRLIKKSGKVEIFLNPSSKVQGAGPHVKFEDKFYTVQNDPKIGFKIPDGSVIRTGGDAKARIVYKNGDQFNVGEGTSYRITGADLKKGSKDKTSSVDLLYGKLRAVISKDGPRNNMRVKTNSAVMGIRGTDFYVDKQSSMKGAEVTVLRGVVEVQPTNKNTKSVKIETGFSATAPDPVKAQDVKKGELNIVAAVVVAQTSKQELVEIQDQSVIKKDEAVKEEVVDSKVAKELAKLEEKAVENTLADIKRYDPQMYEKLKDEKVANVDEINMNVVKKVFTKAPDRPKKPGLDDLKMSDEVYEKYFRIE